MTRQDFLIGAIVSLAFGLLITFAWRDYKSTQVSRDQWRQWADTANCDALRARARDMEP